MREERKPHSRDDEDRLVGYVQAALSRIDAGDQPDLDAICAADPELVPAVAEALGFDDTRLSPPEPPVRSDPLQGRVLAGRYRLGECIGIGAMGAVHAATDLTLHREVAVKILHGGWLARGDRHARFEREARILASLQVPTVVPIHDQGQTGDGLHFLVMDRLHGISLAALMQRIVDHDLSLNDEGYAKRLGVVGSERTLLRQIVSWCEQLARGLAAAHDAGVVHRDVKPSNALITREGRAVLLDFGIAARQGEEALTATAATLGTPWYMAPEQAMSGDTARPAVDVYGLGATLFHLLTRRPPYTGDAAEVILALQSRDPDPPHTLARGLPRDLCAIVEKSLERRPEARYASMNGFAADLSAFLEHRPVVARPLTRTERFLRRLRRRPARAAALTLGLIVLPLSVVAANLYVANAEVRDQALYEELNAQVPALACLEGYPDDRVLQDMSESAAALGLFDRILELRPQDVRARLMRASLRLDRGERQAAVRDLRRLHDRCRSPYSAALLDAYGKAKDSARGAAALDLSGLPEPQSPLECLIAGFHTLRGRADYQKAHEELSRAAAALPEARDLRLLTLLMTGFLETDRAARFARLEEARAEALQLEGVYGRKTARTRHTIGAALVGMQQYAQAITPLVESLAIRPDRHGPLHNLGIAYRRIGKLDQAEECLQRAHALRPWLWNTLHTLAQVQCDRGRFDAALELARRIPEQGTMGEAWKRPLLIARVHLDHALHLVRQQDFVGAQVPARSAITAFDQSLASGCAGSEAAAARTDRSFASMLAAGEANALDLLTAWQRDFADPVKIQNLEVLLGERGSASPDLLLWLRVYLLRLASDLAPDDPAPRRRLEQVLRDGK